MQYGVNRGGIVAQSFC